jgi:hypothetical protein
MDRVKGPDGGVERRWSGAVIGVAVAVFVALLVAVPALFQTFDEAKYLGIGRSVMAGDGPRIVFGSYFLPHSPLWPVLLVAPNTWFGIDALSWGHTLNALSAVTLLVLTGIIGWRIRPAVGALAVVGFVGVTYFHDLTRTARLDVPAAALVLLYLVVGLEAVRRGSIRWSIAAGICFAVGFLVKEIALPFAPIPLLVGILRGRPAPTLASVGGWTLAAAAIGVSWWFLFVANVGHIVYRLGTPAWTLIPLAIATAVAAGLGMAWQPLLRRRATRAGRPGQIVADAPSRARTALAWGLAFAWFAALMAFFSKTLAGRATALIDPTQIAHYVTTWLPGLGGVLVFAWVGVLLSMWAWRTARSRGEDVLAYAEVGLAVVCSAPLVLLVVGVGEPPRNYFAQLGLLAVLSVAGWLWAAESLARRVWSRISRPADLGTGSRRAARFALPTLLAVALLGSSGVLTVHALRYRESATGMVRAQAIDTAARWIRANVAPGSTIAFGSFLGYEMALELPGYRLVQVRQEIVKLDLNAPEGLVAEGHPPTGDFVAADTASRNVNEFQAYRADQLTADFKHLGATIWVYSTGTTTSAPTILAAVPSAQGIHELTSWSWTEGRATLETHVLAVDPGMLAFDPARLFMAPDALDRLLTYLERTLGRAGPIARMLVPRVTVTGDPAVAAPLLDRLRRLEGG